LVILAIAAGIFLLVYGNWNERESGKTVQTTDDAYVRADVTALSTKASGLLARMEVAEYQHVKAGQLIASLRGDDYKAQRDAAQAALEATEAGLEDLGRQEEAANSKITAAQAGVRAAESQIAAAQAGVAAAQSTIRTAEAGLTGVRAQFENASQEIARQQGLYKEKATTLQKLQNQQAQTAAAQASLDSRERFAISLALLFCWPLVEFARRSIFFKCYCGVKLGTAPSAAKWLDYHLAASSVTIRDNNPKNDADA